MHHCVAALSARHEANPLSDQPTLTLVLYLVFLLLLVAFFAGTEVALLTVNRYRLRNRANRGDRRFPHAKRHGEQVAVPSSYRRADRRAVR